MSLHFFFVPASRPGAAQEELNAFLHKERVVALSREFVADGPNSGWAVCVEVTAGPRELPGSLRANPAGRRSESVDYKQVLSAEDFDLYAALREQRKALAQAEGVPVYAVLSNEQLACLATQRITTLGALAQVEGVGPARVLEDRVLHHAVFNLAEPRLETSLTPVAFACRPGRGVHAAVWAVQGGLRRFPWVVQVDVEHYFDNICHQRLMSLLARRFKGQGFLALLQRMVQAAGSDGRGLPIGSLASQHFANAYLDSADRLLLDQPGVGAAVRYMDDMVWFCRSKEQARRSLAVLRDHVEGELGLRLKDRVVLKPSAQGLSFCGWRVRQGVVLPGLRKLRRYRAACRRLKAAEAAGTAPVLLQRVHDAAAAALLPGSSQAFRRRLWWGAGL